MKLAICGPPHSGKSVFLSSLVEKLPEGARICRACPDGEGDWSQKTEQNIAANLREKEKFSLTFVDETIKMIRKYTDRLLLIDTGGKKDAKDLPLIFNEADGIIVLAREDQVAEWEDVAKKSGKPIIAVIATSLDGESKVYDEGETLKGRLVGLERGAKIDADILTKLATRLKIVATLNSSPEEAQADIKFENIAQSLQIPFIEEGGRRDWQAKDLPAVAGIAETFNSREKVHIYGVGQGMLWGTITGAVRPAVPVLHDPWKGYIEVQELELSDNGSDNLLWKTEENGDYTAVKYQIPGTVFGDRKLEEIAPPEINQEKGVVIAGKGPWWLTASIQESYKDAPWIAWLQPQEAKRKLASGKEWHEEHPDKIPAVVVKSKDENNPIGTVIPVNKSAVRPIQNKS